MFLGFLFLGGIGMFTAQAQRDPLKWPFDKYSIWNVPIHNNATYVAAGITQANSNSFNVDEDVVILSSTSAVINVETNYADWSGGDRCPSQGPVLFTAPIPSGYIYDNTVWQGSTPNAGAAILLSDGNRIKQTQPFAKCGTTLATSHYTWDENVCQLKGECIAGAHGGSGMSTIGGTIRYGEFTAGAINHVIKMNLWGKYFLSNTNNGLRWPALSADGGYNDPNSFNYYGGTVTQLRMGSLLALHKNADINSMGFETAPGKILAKTFQNYGAYVVDNTGWNNCAFVTETGPNGIVRNEFSNLYGFGLEAWDNLDNTAWGRDIKRIITNLYVIDNNDASNIGGGPTASTDRRASLAPDITGVALPGKVQAENYNAMSGIQSEPCSDTDGGMDVGLTDAGDWMDYNVNVATAGTYTINYRVAAYSAGQLQLKEGTTLIHTVNIPSTGGWQTWSTVSGTATLSAGNHRLRVYVATSGWNINWIEAVGAPGGANLGKIEAESYSTMNGVQTENTSDTGGGLNVGYLDAGDWMDYTVNVTNAGTYNFNYRVAANSAGQLQLKEGTTILHTIDIPATGGWQSWTTVSSSATLTSGSHTLRVYVSTPGWNFNWFEGIAATGALVNGGFEDNGASQTPTGWSESTDVATSFSEAGGRSGSYRLAHWSSNAYTVSTYQTISNIPNGTYTLSAWYTGGGGQTTCTLGAKDFGGTTQTVSLSAQNYSWTQKSITGIVVTSGKLTIEIYSKANAGNWLRVDDITLTKTKTAMEESSVAKDIMPPTVSFDVYPVPLTDNFTVATQGFNNPEVTIYNVQGQAIAKKQLHGDITELSSQNLPKGIYIISVSDGINESHKKILK